MDLVYRVFVYGTLRKHESNHRYMNEATCVFRHAWTFGSLYDTGCGYPAMTASHLNRVYGEIYEINIELLKRLDWLEGYNGEGKNNEYDRRLQTIFTDFGQMEAFVYVYSPEQVNGLVRIELGDWKCHLYLQQPELLYFAYGSCMDDERFRQAGVKSQFERVLGCGVATNYSLVYSWKSHDGGRADLIESEQNVEGKVYQISQQGLNYLFKREGVHASIYRPAFIDLTINGQLYTNILTFIVIDKQEETAPPKQYAIEILRGAKGIVSTNYYKKLQEDLLSKFDMEF